MTERLPRQSVTPHNKNSFLGRQNNRFARPLIFSRSFVFAFAAVLACSALRLSAATVTVDKINKRLMLDGQPFTIKGMDYSPTRPGSRPGSPSNYNFFADAQTYNNDFPLLKTLGANTIRAYDARNATTAALDAAYANGLYVVMGYPLATADDVTVSTGRAAIQSGFISMVNQFKNHPAVLMWCLGNEETLTNTSALQHPASWYSLLDDCAAAAHAADPNHPVTTANQEFTGLGVSTNNTAGANPTNVDLWGTTIYRGPSFGTAFAQYAAKSDKLLWVAEFGSDAYNTAAGAEDQNQQAQDLTNQWKEIAAQSGNGVVGGCVFEWSDEWWKGGSQGDAIQDVAVDSVNGGYTDPNISEEWWGITAVSSTTVAKRLRAGFYALKEQWNPVTASQGVLFSDKIHNFPNPFMAGSGSTRIQISLGQIPDSVKLDVFDAARHKVVSLRPASLATTLVTADWNGLDENGRPAAPGVYLCRVEVSANQQSDVRFHKIVIVK